MASAVSLKGFDLYELSKKLVLACYTLTGDLPPDEKTLLTHYIRESVLTMHFSVAQGAFLKSNKARRKFLSKAKNALVVIDAAVEVLVETGLATAEKTTDVLQLSSTCYQLLDRLKKEK